MIRERAIEVDSHGIVELPQILKRTFDCFMLDYKALVCRLDLLLRNSRLAPGDLDARTKSA
jgi:hypothetical protein